MDSSHRTVPPGGVFRRSPTTDIAKELLWRREEWIALKNPADDDRRMRPQHVDDRVALKLVQPIRTDHDLIVLAPQIVHPRFKCNDAVDQRSAAGGPIHPANDPTTRKGMWRVPAREALEHLQHAI